MARRRMTVIDIMEIIAAWDTPDFATDLANSLEPFSTSDNELESALDGISAPDYLECLNEQTQRASEGA